MATMLFALALLAAQPAATPAASTAPAAAPADDYLPQGAPADDYGFVAWCDGVLSGHMDLAERVKSVLPEDDVQQKIGYAYLKAYERALTSSAEGKTDAGRLRAQQARAAGWAKWEQARNAEVTLARDTYLGWQLPARCEHAAIRLSGDQNLFRMAPSIAEVSTAGSRVVDPPAAMTAAAVAPAPLPAPLPAPAAVAPPPPPASPAPVQVAEAEAAPAPAPAAPAPAPRAQAQPEPRPVDDGRVVRMPKNGSLLPGFLRRN